MEDLQDLLRQREATIAELERLNSEKDVRISELLSQLDKYKSVLLFAGAPGLPSGVFVAPSAVQVSRKQQRAWGISAEPPSSHSSRSGNTCDSHTCQKFYKDQGSVYDERRHAVVKLSLPQTTAALYIQIRIRLCLLTVLAEKLK